MTDSRRRPVQPGPGRRRAVAAAARSDHAEAPNITPVLEEQAGVTLEELTALYVLDGVKGFGPQKFKALHDEGLTPRDLLRDSTTGAMRGATWEGLRRALEKLVTGGIETYRMRAAQDSGLLRPESRRSVARSDPGRVILEGIAG